MSGPGAAAGRSAWQAAPLGPATASALLAGIVAAFALAEALPTGLALTIVALGVLAWIAFPRLRVPGALLTGFGWASLLASAAFDARLPVALEGSDLQVEGRVVGLPQSAPAQLRFDFRVERAEGEAAVLGGRLLRLGWYGDAPTLEPGSRWRLTLRLRRPRGTVNPGGFDFERHALERGLVATGYVREDPRNARLAAGQGIDRVRDRLSRAIAQAVDAPRARFIQALAVGDTRALDERDWEVLRATGIAHLIAISGLHVGLVAGFGALLAVALYRLWPSLGLRLPLPQGAAALALAAASGYSALAGFALPTVRTLLMIAAALLAVLLRRASSVWQSLALAALAIGIVDPLALLGAGFWLSFLGVAWLLWCLPHGNPGAWRTLWSAQAVSTLGLLPLTVWFFGQASIAGPVANLVAVPWVSFVVVPLALAGTALALLHAPLGAPFFQAAAWCMEWLWWGLEPIARWRGALAYLPEAGALAFGLALLGVFWLLLPRAVPGKALASLLLVALLWPARTPPVDGEAEVWLLDVGQGLSVLVLTREHALLYDAGPSFAGGLDLGDAAVVPALRALGLRRLDAYVESHGDNDHAGGSAAVLRAFAPPRVLASDPRRAGAANCAGASPWEWDGVRFALLHPPPHFPYLGNDSSCVLRIDTAGADLLVPGDISADIERRLLEQSDALPADVLVIPHHGSRTSSSAEFLAAVAPQSALLGVGHRNRFDLPRPDVMQRYGERGVQVWDSARAGAVRLSLGRDGAQLLDRWRLREARLWREP